MAILKETEAVEYLKRARSCIRPDDVNKKGILSLTAAMIDSETYFLEKLMEQGSRDLAQVQIDRSGFPEISLWLADINKAQENSVLSKAQRAKVLLPVFQHLSNLDFENMDLSLGDLGMKLSGSRTFHKVISRLNQAQTDYYLKYIKDMNNFPSEKGLFVLREGKFPIDGIVEVLGNFKSSGIREYGLKYFDSKAGDCQQFMVLDLRADSESKQFRVLTPTSSLYERSEWVLDAECSGGCGTLHSWRFLTNPINAVLTSSADLGAGFMPIGEFELKLNQLNPNLKNFFLNMDSGSLFLRGKNDLLVNLFQANEAQNNIISFLTSILEGTYNDEEFLKEGKDAFAKLNSVYEAFGDEELREELQLSIAEAIKSLRQEVDKLQEQKALESEARFILSVNKKPFYKFW